MDGLRGVVHQVRACRRPLAAVGFEMFAPTWGISCRELRNEARGWNKSLAHYWSAYRAATKDRLLTLLAISKGLTTARTAIVLAN